MPTERTERTLEGATRELIEVLREVEQAVEPPNARRLIRPPTPQGFLEFTSEVGIPAAILVLRTNIAALELLQRSLRMMDNEHEKAVDQPVRDRAADLTVTSLGRLDDALGDLQRAMEGRSTDRSPQDLLEEARERTEQLEAQLSALDTEGSRDRTAGTSPAAGSTGTSIDVEAELDSLRQSVDPEDPDDGSPTTDET